MTMLLPGQTGGCVVKGLAKSETACTMIMMIKCVDASTFNLSKAGYSPVTNEFYMSQFQKSYELSDLLEALAAR